MNIQLVTHNSRLLFLLFVPFLLVAYESKDKPSPAATLTDDALMDIVQRQTPNHPWEAAEPNNGLTRECCHIDSKYPAEGPEIVTSGGSDFDVTATLAGIDREHISRKGGLHRVEKIVRFLEKADYFKGAYSHWWDGKTGRAQPFG